MVNNIYKVKFIEDILTLPRTLNGVHFNQNKWLKSQIIIIIIIIKRIISNGSSKNIYFTYVQRF